MDLAPFTPDRIAALRARYTVAPPPLSVGVVRDFCDSMDHLKELATLQNDMKDVQRPWTFKAVLATVPKGGRVLEIGAGDPHVAGLLSACGYEAWVVDPYDGSGRGPTEFEAFRSYYPALKFVRTLFGPDLAGIPVHGFDCVYSVSVLEHVPHGPLADVIKTARRCLRPGGSQIHSMDHVFKGAGAEHHLRSLEVVRRELGLASDAVGGLLERVEDDPDVYFLSAEAHNLWRGNNPYDEFPMRRCISVQFCAPALS